MGFLGVLAGLVPFLRTKTPHEEALADGKSALDKFGQLCTAVKNGAEAALMLAQSMVQNISNRASAYRGFFDDRARLDNLLSGMVGNIREMDGIRKDVLTSISETNYFSVQFQGLQACMNAVSTNFSAVTKSDRPTIQQLTEAAAALRAMVSSSGKTDLPTLKWHVQNLASTITSSIRSRRHAA